MKKLKKGEMYRFEWDDTYGHHGWFDDEDVRQKTLKDPLQSSVGYFVQEIRDWYVIAKHKNDHLEFPPWGDLCWIPKKTMRSITSLG